MVLDADNDGSINLGDFKEADKILGKSALGNNWKHVLNCMDNPSEKINFTDFMTSYSSLDHKVVFSDENI